MKGSNGANLSVAMKQKQERENKARPTPDARTQDSDSGSDSHGSSHDPSPPRRQSARKSKSRPSYTEAPGSDESGGVDNSDDDIEIQKGNASLKKRKGVDKADKAETFDLTTSDREDSQPSKKAKRSGAT